MLPITVYPGVSEQWRLSKSSPRKLLCKLRSPWHRANAQSINAFDQQPPLILFNNSQQL